ncbi:MAG: hypothetical protein AAFP04_07930 [Myxococcota bacterium]
MAESAAREITYIAGGTDSVPALSAWLQVDHVLATHLEERYAEVRCRRWRRPWSTTGSFCGLLKFPLRIAAPLGEAALGIAIERLQESDTPERSNDRD